MTAKEYLRQYQKIRTMIEVKRGQITLILSALDLASTDYTQDKVQSSPSDRMAEIIAKAADMQTDLEADIKKLLEMQEEIIGVINAVPDSRYRQILMLRYLAGMSWEQIAVKMNYSYRHVTKMHGLALLEINAD